VLELRGPPGGVVALPSQEQPFAAPVSERDPRLLELDLALLPGGLDAAPRLTLQADGTGRFPVARLPVPRGLVQPLLIDAASGAVSAVGSALSLD